MSDLSITSRFLTEEPFTLPDSDCERSVWSKSCASLYTLRLIGIDPGAFGGIAWLDAGGHANALPMPASMTEQADCLRALATQNTQAAIEKTGGYVPGNSGPAAATYARHCGNLEAILYMAGIPCTAVATRVWQRVMGELPKEKRDRKNAIRDRMARLYPHLTVTLRTADALGILTWAIRRQM